MILSPRTPFLLLLFLATPSAAQEPALARKVVLPEESPQVFNRLRAVERIVRPLRQPETAARCLSQLGTAGGGLEMLSALTPVVAEKRPEVWEHLADEYHRILHES